MSYDLHFRRYGKGVDLNDQDVCVSLCNGESVEGIEDLPIPEILKNIEGKFEAPTWNKIDDQNYESESGAFQIYSTNQFYVVHCYGMSGDDMNTLVDVGSEFSCPLYDPQVNERFDRT